MNNNSKVLAKLRMMIIDGDIKPGEKLAEIPIAEHLGVSRTPVRLAFRTLEQEGLLRKREKQGYEVRAFSAADVQCALEVRGALEGIAARRLTEKGLPESTRASLQACLDAEHDMLSKGYLTEDDIEIWSARNNEFHTTIIEASDSQPVADAIARNNHLPFASADSLILDPKALDKEFRQLQFAHIQHLAILDAISRGEGARAESMMKEHAYVGFRYGEIFGKTKLIPS